MSVRAKFAVREHRITKWGGQHGQSVTTVILSPQYDTTIPEDQRYSKATPSGEISMQVDNPVALEQLEVGKTFYVDFTPVET